VATRRFILSMKLLVAVHFEHYLYAELCGRPTKVKQKVLQEKAAEMTTKQKEDQGKKPKPGEGSPRNPSQGDAYL
jgi:hypothetical protein